MRSFARWSSAFLALLLALAPYARSQGGMPLVSASQDVEYEQSASGTVSRQSVRIAVSADVPGTIQNSHVEMRHPSGANHRLSWGSSGPSSARFSTTAIFPTWEHLRGQFPTGVWSIVLVTFNVASPVIQLSLNAPLTDYIPEIANHAELQRWTGGQVRIEVKDTPLDINSPTRVLKISRSDGRVLHEATMTGTSAEVDLHNWIPAGDTGNGELIITRPAGQTRLRFTIKRVPDTPAIVRQPADISVTEGARAVLSVEASGPELRYQWYKDGVPVVGAMGSSLQIAAARPSDAGSYTVGVTNAHGEVTSGAACLTVIETAVAPTISVQPSAVSAVVGSPAQLRVVAHGTQLSYQWQREGVAISGATEATLTLPAVRLSDGGSYRVVVTNSAGAITSSAALLTVDPVTRISNLSIRAAVGGDAGLLTVGFTLGGSSTTAAKAVLLRAIGPTLAVFGLNGVLSNPSLAVLSGASVVARNDDWSGNALVTSTSAAVGAFGLSDPASKDAASVFPAFTGSYTMQIDGPGAGVALAEIYDATADGEFTAATPRLVNVSALTQVGTGGDILITGFAIVGTQPCTVLIRAVGPALAAFGVANPLSDPRLDLYRASGGEPYAFNDNWAGGGNAAGIAAAAVRVGAFALPSGSRDAAIVVSLPPGSYTAQVSGVGGATGKALVEVYEVP